MCKSKGMLKAKATLGVKVIWSPDHLDTKGGLRFQHSLTFTHRNTIPVLTIMLTSPDSGLVSIQPYDVQHRSRNWKLIECVLHVFSILTELALYLLYKCCFLLFTNKTIYYTRILSLLPLRSYLTIFKYRCYCHSIKLSRLFNHMSSIKYRSGRNIGLVENICSVRAGHAGHASMYILQS